MNPAAKGPLIIPELRVLVLNKRHVGSGNEIEFCPSCLTQSSSMGHVRNGCSQSILVPSATRLECRWRVRFADHVTKRNGGSGDENAPRASRFLSQARGIVGSGDENGLAAFIDPPVENWDYFPRENFTTILRTEGWVNCRLQLAGFRRMWEKITGSTGWRSACACAFGVGEMFKAFVRASYWLYWFQFFPLFFTWKHLRIHRSSFQ